MAIPAENEQFTFKDYISWDDDTRWEIIEGIPYNMSPAPSWRHQEVLLELAAEFRNFLKDKPCRPCIAPFSVRLLEAGENEEQGRTVVEPDLSIVCDPSKLDERGCLGAPDLVVEILSPSTAGKDMNEKKTLYEKHGVKEYWIVLPYEDCIQVFKPGESGEYRLHKVYATGDTISSSLFPGLSIELSVVFKRHKGA